MRLYLFSNGIIKEILYKKTIINNYNYNYNYVCFNLIKKIEKEEKDMIYNIENISDIKFSLYINNKNIDNTSGVLNDYLYNYSLEKDKNSNKYYLYKYNLKPIYKFSKLMNSNCFINNL